MYLARGTRPAQAGDQATNNGLCWRGLIALCLCLSWSAPICASTTEITRAKHWLGAMTAARSDYEARVVEMALEKSQAKYGPFELQIVTDIAGQRLEPAVLEGELVNIVTSPAWISRKGETRALTIIPIPIAHGLLGYRQCIVRKENLPRFAEVQTLADLQKLSMGVGTNWAEMDVFRENDLPWHNSNSIEQLLFMLARSRFDYLPLGLMEAESTMANSKHGDELTIVPDLIIYYPHPIFIQVSVGQPLLTERLEYGLKAGIADGTLEQLFNEHYGEQLKVLRSPRMRVITLKNPDLPSFIKDEGPELIGQKPPAAGQSALPPQTQKSSDQSSSAL